MPGSSLRCDHGWVGCCVTNHTSAGFPFSFPSMPNDVSSLPFCCSTSGALLPSCPASLDGSSWCSWEHQAHHTEQNQQPHQCLGCVLIDIPEHPKQRCKPSKHAITTPEVHQTAGELVDMGYCDSQKHGRSIAQHHWGAFIALTTKRSKGTPGEMSTPCLSVPCVYTEPPLADPAQDTVQGQEHFV